MELPNLKTLNLARDFNHYKNLDSTQAEIFRRIERGNIKNGSLVLADLQTLGVGTHGRKWLIDETGNITFSFYYEVNSRAEKLEGLTTDIAKIIVDIFKKLYNIELNIKLPNDIVYNGKKIGGILTQSKSYENIIKYLVIGIGINTNGTKFNDEIKEIASSIKKEFNLEVDNLKVISEFCNIFEENLLKRSN